MMLEHWDPLKKKYVLYRDGSEHHADCVRFPFENIPRRVFLDTNVINLLVKYGTLIFEQEAPPAGIDRTRAIDIEGLMHVFYVGARADWDLLGSPKTLDELSKTKNESLRDDLLEYAIGLVNRDLSDEDVGFAIDFGRRLVGSSFVAALPDPADQELIGNAIGLRCDAFCTCDRATIVNNKHQLTRLPIRIVTPSEWWNCIKPWAALWC